MGILEDLERQCPSIEEEARQIVSLRKAPRFSTEIEAAAASYFVVKQCVESEVKGIETKIGDNYISGQGIAYFRMVFLEPLYDYLDEQLDDQRLILALLKRYKHKCEWFQREQLFDGWNKNKRDGEKRLALHLYEFLYDQGLDFAIEPWSISGRADLVAAQTSDDPLIADAKIWASGTSKTYIAKGFKQIYTYTVDFDEPFGYLIVFNVSGQDLRFTLSRSEQRTPFVVHNNKTIFILTIDISPYDKSASKRSTLKPKEIVEDFLISSIKAEEADIKASSVDSEAG